MKGKGISKVLSCLVVFAILMSAIPFSVLAASNSSDDVMGDVLDSLSEVDTHEDIVVSGVDNATNEAGCNFSDSYIADNTSKLVTALGVTDTLTVNVKNTLGYSLPDCGGRIKVALFDEGYHFKGSVDVPYSGGKSSCPVTFYGVTDGKYFIEVYQTPNTGLKLSEFWGADGVTVSGSTTKKDFVRHTQWFSDVKINGESPGNKIKVNPGEKVHVDITVKNDDKGAFSKNVKVRLLLTKDRSSSFYDLDETHGPVTIERNKEGYFGYDFKPSEAGTYYFYCVVYSDYNDKYIVVDQHDWCKAFERKGTLLLSVPYEHQDDVPWCVLASTSMLLKYYGKNVHMWDIAEAEGISRDRGANFKQMANYITSMGFDVPQKVDDDSKEDDGEIIAWTPTLLSTPDNLRDYMARELTEERNPIILMVSDINHSIVVMGVTSPDIDNPTFYIHDPSGAFLSDALEKKPETLETLISYPVHWEDFKKYWRTILHLSGGFCTISVSADPNPSSATMSDLFFCVNDKSGSAWREYDKGIKWNRSGTEVIDNDYSISFPPSAKPIFSVSATTTLGSPERQECELVLLDSETVIKHSTVNLERNSFKRYGYGIEKGLTFADYGFAQGRHDIYLSLRDKHGKELDRVGPIRFTIKESTSDTTPPETKCILSPSSPNGEYGWYVTPVTVTLESTDDSSGIEWIKYRIDSGSWQIYSGSKASFKVSEDGLHYITYYAKDKAGNEEKQKLSPFFFIDKTKPSASISINNGAEYANSMSVTLHLTYSDNMGVRDCRYKNEGKSWTSWESCSSTKSWTLAAGEGTKKVYYQVRDTAGNTKEVYDTIVLKQEEPKLCTSPDPPSPNFGTVAKDQTRSWDFFITNCGSGTLTWSVSDDRDWITVNPTSGSTTTEADVVTVTIDTHGLSPGTHTGYVTVTSNGGSKTGTITVEVPKPSNKPPTNPTLTPDKSSPQPAGTTIKWTASATDPDGDQLYYRFWLRGPATGNSWQIKRDWSTANTWTWSTTSDDVGESDICVWIRDGHHASTRSKDIEKIVYDYRVTPEKQRPTAKIESITPNPATQGKDTVHFKGHGTDTDGYIVEYYWTSSKDGFMSSSKEFTKSASDLSVGTHTIYFKVKDNDGQWSDWDTAALTIKKPPNQPPVNPILTPDKSSPQPAGTTIKWAASATDPDGDPLYYEFWLTGPATGNSWKIVRSWSMDNIWTWSTTSDDVGESDILVWIRDGHHASTSGYDLQKIYWNYEITEKQRPTAFIDSLTPNPATQGKDTVHFKGHGTDTDGYIVEYYWTSSKDGFMSSSKEFTKSASDLSVGTHTIYFKVKDNDGQWSDWDTAALTIKPSEKPDLIVSSLTFNPNPANKDKDVTVKVTVKNQGKGDAGPHYEFLGYPDRYTLLKEWYCSGLKAGASRTFTHTLENVQSSDTYEACADWGQVVEESNEDNNCLTAHLTVQSVSELNYKLDEYGIIQQEYNSNYADNKASPPFGLVLKPYIDLIPYGSVSDKVKVEIGIKNGQVTIHDPIENAILSSDKSKLTWSNQKITTDYHAELFYEANFLHPQEVEAKIIPDQLKADVRNICGYPLYNIIVLYPDSESGYWHYGTLDYLSAGAKRTVYLSSKQSPESVVNNLYNYLEGALNDVGLVTTQHRNDWISEWLNYWLGMSYGSIDQSRVIYRIPQNLYEQYFTCSASPEPSKGMVRVGLVELFNVPTTSDQTKCKVQITSDSSLQDRPSIVYANGYYYVAYQSWEKGRGIFIKKFDPQWNFKKKKEVVSGSAYYDSPSLVFANNKLYVAYVSNEKGANKNDYDVIVKEYDPNSLSCTRGEKYLTTLQSCQDLPALYYKNGYFYLAYQSWEKGNGDIFIKKFDSNWNLKKKVQVTSKSSYQDRPSIIYANGYFYVAYHSKETGDLDIFVKRLDANLKLDSWKKQITSESSHQSYPFITFVNNQFTIVYASTETGTLGIYMKKYNRNWNFIGKTKVVDSSANERRPSHTWDGSNYWVAYVHNYGESKDWNIFAIIPGCEDGASPTPTPSPSCCPSMSITTGQDTYMPGDNVYVSITLTGRSGCTFRLNSPSIVSLIAPTGETVTQTDMAQGITSSIAPGGHYTIGRSMKLPLNAPLGRYDVKVSLSGGKCTKTANGLFHVSYSEPV